MLLVSGEDLLDPARGRSLTPFDVQDVHPQPVPLGHLDPQVAELPVARREHAVARRQGVDQGRLPGARAAAGEDERLTGRGLEQPLQVPEQPDRQLGEHRGPVILHSAMHGAQDSVRDVRGPGNEEEVTASHSLVLEKDATCPGILPLPWPLAPAHPLNPGRSGRSPRRGLPPHRNGRAACAGGTLGPSGTVAWRHRNRSSRDRMAATGSSTRRASRRVRPGPPPDSRPPVDDPSYIRLIDPHPEGAGGDHDRNLVA